MKNYLRNGSTTLVWIFFCGTKNGALRNPFLKVLSNTFICSLTNYLRKWIFKEPLFERFFLEPKMVLLWRHSEEPFLKVL